MKNISIADYFSANRKVEAKNRRIASFADDPRLVRIGLVGSFTLNGIKEVLNVKLDEAGLILKTYMGQYNQYIQELLNANSGLYKFKPQLVIVFLDLNDLLGDHYHFPYRMTGRDRKALVRKKTAEIMALIKAFGKYCDGYLILNNFSVPTHSTMGILESKQEFGFFEMVRSLNRSLEETFIDDPHVHLFDYDNFLNRWGKIEASDDKMRYLADMKLSQKLVPLLCDEYMRYIKAIKGKARKCIVVDLDNTLWGGIVGEDGFDGIKLGPTPPGNVFVEFQKYLLSLLERGIVLAVNSNNNQADAMRVIREHPYMILRENCFASIKINWNNKPNNIVEIARDLNIGLDSIMYIDDDKRNRQLVRESLPMVSVLELPEEHAHYMRALKDSTDLETLHVTEEDKRRGAMYAEERKRKETRSLFTDIGEFLAHLDITVSLLKADSFSIPRISQLTQRTNQFNMTTRRYDDKEIRSRSEDKQYLVYAVGVKDKFGDNGISGAVILKRENNSLIVDNFLMSCRVLGKGIEKSVLDFCVEKARKLSLRNLVCEFIPTEKNAIARAFLKKSGFKLLKKIGQSEFWRLSSVKRFTRQDYVKVIKA